MERRISRSIVVVVLLLTIVTVTSQKGDEAGLRRQNSRVPWLGESELSSGQLNAAKPLQQARAWAVGRAIIVELGGATEMVRLPAEVTHLEYGGSPDADLTATTLERRYAISFRPRLRLLYSYPNYTEQSDRIIVDKSENTLFFYRDGKLVVHYKVATGRVRHYTPEGEFHIAMKLRDPEGPDAEDPRLGRRWLGLAVPNKADKRGPADDKRAPAGSKYGIHGTNEPESIGKHASGGCVRMRDEDILSLYNMVDEGTVVEIRQ